MEKTEKCGCICHVEGLGILHRHPCCKDVGRKYITKEEYKKSNLLGARIFVVE